jgi:tRNA isopentenyl-2-thiomethyl-A-37 hydroxylase MiaE
MKSLIVNESKKYGGLGVFASKDFKKDDVVNEYKLVPIAEADFILMSDEEKFYILISRWQLLYLRWSY